MGRAGTLELELTDEESFLDYAYEKGWTDGLPVVPPTLARVARMIAAAPQGQLDSLGLIEPRGGEATIERIAINAVMAGCKPEYLPTILAAVSLLARPEMNTGAMQATTSPATPLLIVNGPVRGEIGLHAGRGCLGPGTRANVTIGRAIRLILQNIGGGIPDQIDKSTHGLPAKFSLCVPENEEESPWPSLHEELGRPKGKSSVTMTSVISISNVRLPDPRPNDVSDEILILGDALAQRGSKSVQVGKGNPVVVLSVGTARIFASSGYDKDRLRQELFDAAKRPEAAYANEPLTHYLRVDGQVLPCVEPADIIIVVAGGPEPNQALYMTSFVDSGVLTAPVLPADS